MSELKTEPAFPLSRVKRPWWVALVIGGVSTGIGIVAALGLTGASAARGEPPPHVSLAGLVQQDEQAAWRARMEQKIDFALRELGETKERLARMEGRLERK